jgi:CDP-glucose 4,6-dehydratase
VGQREGALENVVNPQPTSQDQRAESPGPWQGRRVFLTGHTGFKGGWLALWLAHRGAHIRGFALDPPTTPSLFMDARIAEDVDDVRGDIRDYPRLEAALREFAPDVVFHLAAQPLVRQSYADPLGTYSINVMGTANVLEAVRKSPSVRAVVCVTTDKCYQDQDWDWPYRETDPLGGYDPYASSKACAELVAAGYRSSFFSADGSGGRRVCVATARAGNVVGGGDWSPDRLIPDLVRGFESGQPVLIRNPQAVRPWQHVLDASMGYMLLAERLCAGGNQFARSFNFGPADGDMWSVERIANRMAERWGGGARWIRDAAAHPHESRVLRVDSSRARTALGWKPRLTTEAALDWTLDCYRARRDGADLRHNTLAQIDTFEKLVV